MIYQMGAKKLAGDTGMTLEEAQSFIKRYLGQMKGVAKYRIDQRNRLQRDGYVETLFGRRRYLPKIHSDEREAPSSKKWIARNNRDSAIREGGNHPVQGTNADICKMAMIEIQRKMNRLELKTKLVLQVHDEIVLDVPEDELPVVKDMVEKIMTEVVALIVPLVCDGKYADSWQEAH